MESEKGWEKMSEGRKKQAIEYQYLRNGQLTPGAALDYKMDQDIQELDRAYREVNFGIPIDHDTFDEFIPPTLDKEKDVTAYRIWKQRQIIFKRQQLIQRQVHFA